MGLRESVIVAACVVAFWDSSASAADDVGAAARGVVRVFVAVKNADGPSVSLGSGFAISPHHIVTNAHVVDGAENPFADSFVAIVPSEGSRALPGSVVAYDRARDLAVVDVGEARLEPLAIYSGPVDSGSHAAALGYPGNVDLATVRSLDDLFTPTSPVRSEGNISSERAIDGKSALLHTAAISRGNSGGPLVDACGRVLGVNTFTTRSDSGDAPFGFAILSQELTSFLRERGEQFQQVSSACVTLAEQAQREQQAREASFRKEEAAQAERERQVDVAEATTQDSRLNHAVSAALLALLSIIAGAMATALFLKDRTKTAVAASAMAMLSLAGGAYAFLSRPGLDATLPPPMIPAAADADPLSGRLLCQVKPDVSRVTVSTTEDVAMNWDESGCMNGRTQYLRSGEKWRKVLVPNGSQTVFVQDFDPVKREYVSTRYLLSQIDMERLREIRSDDPVKACNSSPFSMQELRDLNERLVNSLPATPNEKLVYSCSND